MESSNRYTHARTKWRRVLRFLRGVMNRESRSVRVFSYIWSGWWLALFETALDTGQLCQGGLSTMVQEFPPQSVTKMRDFFISNLFTYLQAPSF